MAAPYTRYDIDCYFTREKGIDRKRLVYLHKNSLRGLRDKVILVFGILDRELADSINMQVLYNNCKVQLQDF